MAWEGEKTLTFTVEDALLSPISFSMLSGAGLIKQTSADKKVHVHATSRASMNVSGNTGSIDLSKAIGSAGKICKNAPIFVVVTEEDGSLTGISFKEGTIDDAGKIITLDKTKQDTDVQAEFKSRNVFVDYYVLKNGTDVDELQIDAGTFAGYYYVEANTFYKRQIDGKDMPAELTFPNVKIQSNFTFSMASTGDPSTFTFTMDAFPGYTYFNQSREVLCAIQIVDEAVSNDTEMESVFAHDLEGTDKETEYEFEDSVTTAGA